MSHEGLRSGTPHFFPLHTLLFSEKRLKKLYFRSPAPSKESEGGQNAKKDRFFPQVCCTLAVFIKWEICVIKSGLFITFIILWSFIMLLLSSQRWVAELAEFLRVLQNLYKTSWLVHHCFIPEPATETDSDSLVNLEKLPRCKVFRIPWRQHCSRHIQKCKVRHS